ncbi:unnamed protein product [Anisakis simplex]|uniref:Chondroitin proteoglycan 4 domain-containing protein n=1 Tax=Anisakis simplex TaxID=6269 RepID=A0A0M3K886_ANISI|nr:unnamed protein product [Anisakis simplex]
MKVVLGLMFIFSSSVSGDYREQQARAIQLTKQRQNEQSISQFHRPSKAAPATSAVTVRSERLDVVRLNHLIQRIDKRWTPPSSNGSRELIGSNFQYRKTCANIYKARHNACEQLGFGIMCFNYCHEQGENLRFACQDASDAAYCKNAAVFDKFLVKYQRDSYKAKTFIHQMLSRCYATAICTNKNGLLNSTLIRNETPLMRMSPVNITTYISLVLPNDKAITNSSPSPSLVNKLSAAKTKSPSRTIRPSRNKVVLATTRPRNYTANPLRRTTTQKPKAVPYEIPKQANARHRQELQQQSSTTTNNVKASMNIPPKAVPIWQRLLKKYPKSSNSSTKAPANATPTQESVTAQSQPVIPEIPTSKRANPTSNRRFSASERQFSNSAREPVTLDPTTTSWHEVDQRGQVKERSEQGTTQELLSPHQIPQEFSTAELQGEEETENEPDTVADEEILRFSPEIIEALLLRPASRRAVADAKQSTKSASNCADQLNDRNIQRAPAKFEQQTVEK